MSHRSGFRRTVQRAKASGTSSVIQVGGHLYSYPAPGVNPAPKATAPLPSGPGFLVGRDGIISEFLDLLSPEPDTPHQVVAALAGLPGVGKTALVLHVAHHAQLAGWFTGGVLFADLRGYELGSQSTADQVIGGWLRALGVRDPDMPPTPDQREALYRSLLYRLAVERRRVLLIADNVSSADQVRPLIPAQGEHRLLVTSRDTLTSLPARLIDLDEIPPGPAADLIANVLLRARPQDSRVQAEAEALSRLAILCGGLALALELAAQVLAGDPGMRIANLTEEIASELNCLLVSPAEQDGSSRLAPVHAAFDLSYRRLSPEAASLFVLLPVNPGPEISTEAVAALSGQSVRRARTYLAELAQASLLKERPTGGNRWRLHDLIWSYANGLAEHTTSSEARAEALGLLLGHYRATARDAGRYVESSPTASPSRFGDRTRALGWLDDEHANLIAAVSIAATSGHETTAVSLAISILPFLERRFYNEAAIVAGETALNVARRMGDRPSEAALLIGLGLVLANARRLDEALVCQKDSVMIARELGDRSREISALSNLGNALWDMRRHDEALTMHREAAVISQELGDRAREANAVNEIGACLREIGRLDEALTAHEKSFAIYRELGDRYGGRHALNNIGIALDHMKRFNEAIAFYQDALSIYREVGDLHGEATPLTNVGNTLCEVRRFSEAITAHEQAVAIYRAHDDRFSEAEALGNLGNALQGARRLGEAIKAERQAVAIFTELGERYDQAKALDNLGRMLRRARRFGEAIKAERQAVAIFMELGEREHEAGALTNLGAALIFKGRFAAAITCFQHSIGILREIGELPPVWPDPSNPSFRPRIRSRRSL